MNNQQKLEFILKLERKRKIKRYIVITLLAIFAGVLLIYFQFKNFQAIS